VNWNFKDYAIADDAPFRIAVLVGDLQLGYLDLVKQGSVFRNQTTGKVVSRAAGGKLPLKFRIETGALCSPGAIECFEGQVGPAGGTFTIARSDGTKPAGTEFPQGALQETVNLIIERVTSGECLPTDVPQYEGCYRFHTEPYVEQFELPVTVGVCLLDPAGLPFLNDQQLRLWKWSEVAGDPLVELERALIDYLECPPLTQLGAGTSNALLLGAARAGAWLLKPFASVFGPRDAFALTIREGGKLINFSRIGWVRPLSVELRSGDGQSGRAGQALPVQPRARVVNKYGMTVQGVPDRVVQFTPSGDGSASPATAVTDAAGEAATTWTLSTTPGANTLLARTPTSRAIAPVPYEAEALFQALGTPPVSLIWLPTLAPTWDTSGSDAAGQQATVVISVVNGPVLQTISAGEGSDGYFASWVVPPLDPALVYRITVMAGGTEIGHIDLLERDGRLRNAATDAVVLNLSFSNTLLIRFRLVL
jgi:hypothetical protein